ncbi:hypothetical protein ACS0TY_000016 [Phlomoides rotata]
MGGTFTVFCIENLSLISCEFLCRPYAGELVAGDPQRRLNLQKPSFLGYVVNMIDSVNLYSASGSWHSLRETLFFHLFSYLQVYKSREDMLKATSLISHGAISLDGGLIRSPGVHSFGHNQEDIDVKFPCISKKFSLPVDYFDVENRLKEAEWKKDRASEDLMREQKLLDRAKFRDETKKREFVRLLKEITSYAA